MDKNSAFLKQIDFTGKTALVTGASRGIGEAIALSLASLGAEVILVSRKLEGLTAVEKKITASGGKATSIPCNTGNMNEIDNLFSQIRGKYEKIDILVNNSATNPFFGNNLDATESAWDKTFSVNLKGYFFITQHAAKIMKEKGMGGSIVNIGSVNGIRPTPMQGMYSITKAGVISMTQSFAKELAPFKIRVNAVLPGMTDTKFSSVMTQNPELLNKFILPSIPMGRIAQPDEISGAVIYLVSDAASYTTGSCITVDGGILA
ncbi:MAG: short-chain dehydrogenase [Spirochaetes bacterium RBG_13_51_14]|nr:MAG: short-chain dehydrogenase [Spirochaetes bacterium RBG_13_51_14]